MGEVPFAPRAKSTNLSVVVASENVQRPGLCHTDRVITSRGELHDALAQQGLDQLRAVHLLAGVPQAELAIIVPTEGVSASVKM